MAIYHVATTTGNLNLRQTGEILPNNVIGSLPSNTDVESIQDAPVNGWLNVSVTLNGKVLTGWVAFQYLMPGPGSGLAGRAPFNTWQLGVNYDWIRGNNGSTTQVGTITVLGRI